jgi:hypothetical protein
LSSLRSKRLRKRRRRKHLRTISLKKGSQEQKTMSMMRTMILQNRTRINKKTRRKRKKRVKKTKKMRRRRKRRKINCLTITIRLTLGTRTL